MQRRILQLEIEQVALEKESDDASIERLDALHDELAQLKVSAVGGDTDGDGDAFFGQDFTDLLLKADHHRRPL